jgi:hypothetical protein
MKIERFWKKLSIIQVGFLLGQ